MYVDFNSIPNWIVILFNLMYHVFYVEFIYKGCVCERVCEDLRQLKIKAVFVGSSQVGFPRSEACA